MNLTRPVFLCHLRFFFGFLIFSTITNCRVDDKSNTPLFEEITTNSSGIHFSNRIAENDTFNILNLEYVYNGGGVGVGDFNADGLEDLFFSGNTAPNALYLNKGDLHFEDVTLAAGVAAQNRWCSGVAVVDINSDGLDDIYVCATVLEPTHRRTNLLFINQGPDDKGVPRFSESAKAYGLADTTHSTNAVFFDYDLDGDLDCYILVNHMDDKRLPNRYRPKTRDGSSVRNDKLYRNDGPSEAGHPTFTEVTKEAGILKEGYGLGVAVCDLNEDGWPDLYIANDYLSNDLAWINQKDGTFKDLADQLTKHTSYSAMGIDIADLNGDSKSDIVTLDMLPSSNYRRKTMIASANFNVERNNWKFGYHPQYMRNVLQLNRGKLNANDSLPVFSEIGFYSGIAATDWSWSVLAADVDLDSDADLLITNGFPRDVTDLDFMDYSSNVSSYASPEHLLSKIPSVLISNYGFENDGQHIPKFDNATERWGLKRPSFSSGAATVDLDGDGDLDYVVNCINDSVLVYRNNAIGTAAAQATKRYLQIDLEGTPGNPHGFGANVYVELGDKTLHQYQSPYRGYLSSVSTILSFGLDTFTSATVRVVWPGGKTTWVKNVPSNQLLRISQNDAQAFAAFAKTPHDNAHLREVASEKGLSFDYSEQLFVDFDYQRLIPRQLSQYGPALAVGDANNDGLDDLLVGGPLKQADVLFLQQADGSFLKDQQFIPLDSLGETTSALFFDADQDGDQDLYVAHGSVEAAPGHESYRDAFYRNEKGSLTLDRNALPEVYESSSVVRAADLDQDGDLDLFVGARTVAGQFPKPARSTVLINENGIFREKTSWKLPQLGMVTDAVLVDFDGDGWQDLFVTEDWGQVRHFRASETGFGESPIKALNGKTGCWNSLLVFDGDQDGDLDLVVGNLGRNNQYHRAGKDFVRVYAGDFDRNGTLDPIPTTFFENQTGKLDLFPLFQRQESERQVVAIKDAFPLHKDFALVTAEELMGTIGGVDSFTVEANYLANIYLENIGKGEFVLHELPREAQLAPICGLRSADIDNDGTLELLISGNDYGAEVRSGPMDALHGLVLKGGKQGIWNALPYETAGLAIPGDGTALVELLGADGKILYVAGQNKGRLLAFAKTNDNQRLTRFEGIETFHQGQAIPFGMGNASSGGRYVPVGAN